MKLKLIIFETKTSSWLQAAREEYLAKISAFVPMTLQVLKSPSAERESADVKIKKEGDLLLKQIDKRDMLILFDPRGKTFSSSEEFAQHISRQLESGKATVNFCIGGPYGFAGSVKERSQASWSLSGLTFNHWVAQLVALEQIYRGMAILKGIPYHNS